jgi:hypothetical protein
MINKNLFKMRPLVAAVIVATGLVISTPILTPKAQAVYLVSDAAAFVQETYANTQRMIESSKELTYLKTQLDMIGSFAEMAVDNVNNGFANVIARLDKGEEERQNLEQLEKSQPNQAACGLFTASAGINEASCASEDKMEKFVAARSQNNSMSTGSGKFECTTSGHGGSSCTFVPGEPPSVDNVNKKNTVDAIAVIDRCKQLLDPSGKSWCEHPELMMFSAPLDKNQYEAVDIQISLASNLNKPVPLADDTLDKDSPEAKRARAADLRRENMRESAVVAQKNLHMLMNGTRDPTGNKKGEVEVLNTYMSERLGSENWMCEVTQSCNDPTKSTAYVAPAELEKRKIEMDAVLLHIALQQYKSSLRVEKYLTDMNLMQIESVTR